ncbi:MAG: secretion protein HlyD [Bdellovibrio sp.]|nr:MAG: secretion protein HlyD [Bdellovibrio sp.]
MLLKMELLRRLIRAVGRYPWVTLLCLLAVVAGAVYARTLSARSDGQLTEPLKKSKIIETVYGIGTVTATRSWQLKLGTTLTIAEEFVDAGDEVKKGQKLLRIDRQLYTAPFDGTVTDLPFKPGETVPPGVMVTSVVDFRDRYLLVSMEQQGLIKIKRQQKARLSFDTIRNQSYEGQVDAVYSSSSGLFLVRINLSHLPEVILPGMTADVAITVDEHDNALVVPVAALDRGQVWVKREHGMPTAVPVRVGITDGALAEIISGEVQAGDRLIIRNRLAK